MRLTLLAVLCALALPVLAQESATVLFDPPSSGGAPTGYRLYRDNVLVVTVTAGQTIPNLAPDANPHTYALEAFNATGPGPRVTFGPTSPGPLPPGPPRNFRLVFDCAVATPPTCVQVTP